MNRKQPPRVQLHFEPEEVETINYEDEASEPELSGNEEEEHSMPEGAAMPEVVEKKSIVQEDIFDLPTLAVMPKYIKEDLVLDEMEDQLETRAPRPVKTKGLTKSGKPRKPMSEAHKAKLAMAREKAMISRKAKAIERKKDKAMESETKQLQKLKKEKDFNKLKKQVTEEDLSESEPPAKLVRQNAVSELTRADLEQAQFDAIMKYEILRKERKVEKKKLQKLEDQKQEIMNKLAPQTSGYGSRNAQGKLNNRWDNCY